MRCHACISSIMVIDPAGLHSPLVSIRVRGVQGMTSHLQLRQVVCQARRATLFLLHWLPQACCRHLPRSGVWLQQPQPEPHFSPHQLPIHALFQEPHWRQQLPRQPIVNSILARKSAAGQHQVERVGHARDGRQDRGRTKFRHDTQAHKGKREFRVPRYDTYVALQRQRQTNANGMSIDGCNHRLANLECG